MSTIRFALLPLLLSLAAVPAHAAPKNFHVGAGCTYTTIQAALDAERASPGTPADFIWVARNQSYAAQDIQIHDQNVFVYGGVDNCTDSSISGTTSLSGLGGAAKSVMTISGRSQVWLSGITITKGDNTASGVGGGINFVGRGKLNISSSTITGNQAGYGGGINFNGTGGTADVAELWINYDTQITGNTAVTSGGGLRVEGNAVLRVVDDQVWIALNHADGGYGGGIQVIGPAEADIGSPGYRFAEYVALLYQNTAKYGGGLSINGGTDADYLDTFVRLFATDPQHPVRIEGNMASQDGGGIYLRPEDTIIRPGGTFLCASDFRITSNSAAEGSAIYTYGGPRSSVSLDRHCGSAALAAVACTSTDCNLIDGNVARNNAGQATSGSTILIHNDGTLYAGSLRMTNNRGGYLLRILGGDLSNAHANNCLIAGNLVTGDLIRAESQTKASLQNCTIADNQVGSGVIIRAGGVLDLFDMIVAQGPTTSLVYSGGNPANLTIDYVMSREVASLASGAHLIQTDPLFVNSPGGNYRLMLTSPAIDVAPAATTNLLDLEGRPRDQDMPAMPNLDGIRDLGAYERQLRYCGAADTVFCNNFDND